MNINKKWEYKSDKIDLEVDIYNERGWAFNMYLGGYDTVVHFNVCLYKLVFEFTLDFHK